jgi:hypothetical protein
VFYVCTSSLCDVNDSLTHKLLRFENLQRLRKSASVSSCNSPLRVKECEYEPLFALAMFFRKFENKQTVELSAANPSRKAWTQKLATDRALYAFEEGQPRQYLQIDTLLLIDEVGSKMGTKSKMCSCTLLLILQSATRQQVAAIQIPFSAFRKSDSIIAKLGSAVNFPAQSCKRERQQLEPHVPGDSNKGSKRLSAVLHASIS